MNNDDTIAVYRDVDISDKEDKGVAKCRQWLSSCSLSDVSTAEEVSICDTVSTENDLDLDDKEVDALVDRNDHLYLDHKLVPKNKDILSLNDIVPRTPSHFKNINVYKSQNVHIGDVTNINGPVYINNFSPTINRTLVINNHTNQHPKSLPIVARTTWLAQPPLIPEDVKFFTAPPKFVIISHSATEEGTTQTQNNLIVRLIQQFHIESRNWNDISYNFLIGAEGSVYEGRGWNVIGAHTYGYNKISVGICFIGCYMRKLPSPIVIEKAKSLISYGVKIGAIAEDYKILAHRQCSSTESPGSALFEEIKTWERWDSSVSVDSPSLLSEYTT